MGVLQALKGSKYKVIDAHLHVTDFLQSTSGLGKCIKYMNKANMEYAVIFGLPVSKIWASWEKQSPSYYLGDNSKCYYYNAVDFTVAHEYSALNKEDKKRLFPLIGGFNPTDKYSYKHVERMIKYFPNIWHGLGEILFRHDDLTNLTYGDPPRANHPGMDSIYDLCVDLDMPICIHQNITSVGNNTYPQWLHELEEALQQHPKVRVVWAHCGVSRRVYSPIYYQIVKRLLEAYENLFVDYSWIVYENFICPKKVPDENWIEMTEKFSERICIGTDVVDKFEYLSPQIQKYDVFMDRLSEKARQDIAFDTAYKLYSKVRC
ncbi:MAG: amidohydrolase family protein [Spirochaetales bacterium]|nr:amidohydrolase family protein [Spirochaetales bacterium]